MARACPASGWAVAPPVARVSHAPLPPSPPLACRERRSVLSGTPAAPAAARDRKSTRLNSSHGSISYAVFCLKKKKKKKEKNKNRKNKQDVNKKHKEREIHNIILWYICARISLL